MQKYRSGFLIFLAPWEPHFLSKFFYYPILLLPIVSLKSHTRRLSMKFLDSSVTQYRTPQCCFKAGICGHNPSPSAVLWNRLWNTEHVAVDLISIIRWMALIILVHGFGWSWDVQTVSNIHSWSPSLQHLPLTASYRQKKKKKVELVFHVWHHLCRTFTGLGDPEDQRPHQSDSPREDAGGGFTLVKSQRVAAQTYPVLPRSQAHVCCVSPCHTPYKQQFNHKQIWKWNSKHQNQQDLQPPTQHHHSILSWTNRW